MEPSYCNGMGASCCNGMGVLDGEISDGDIDMNYHLSCLNCGKVVEDNYTNACSSGCDALLRTEYGKRLYLKELPGIFKFMDWLPVEDHLPVDSAPITYKSKALASEIGLKNLYISFSGYWPEKGANIRTCSFKELEALPTLLRAKRVGNDTLVIPSAGNTSRAFSQISSLMGGAVVTVVPESCLHRMWTTEETGNVCLISVRGDYTDAIGVGNEIGGLDGLVSEGGVKNVARRDGMGTVMLDAAVTTGILPDHYFQAVGSGTGAIAAWEASERLIRDGRFGDALPELHLSQNLPFTPMYNAWREGRQKLSEEDMHDAESAINMIRADVLSNRAPPYSIKGGVYDALVATRGRMYAITNKEGEKAEKLFESAEEIDVDPAASICIASLIKAVEKGNVGGEDRILLNVTGGGYKRLEEDYNLCEIIPYLCVNKDIEIDDIEIEIEGWVEQHV